MRKNAEIVKNTQTEPPAHDMELINRYTRRTLDRGEVYTFSVVLCDNEIDRDYERFTVQSLYKLKELFLGKTGVFDHNPKAENQTARIYSVEVESVKGKTTSAGDGYCRLVARAYMPRSRKTEDMILMLDSGIQKEVSVGCAVEKSVCSVCGAVSGGCTHRKGKTYGGKLCYYELLNPYDAYEWSFVAVPAQRNAGVIKAYKGDREVNMQEILKGLHSGEVSLDRGQCEKLCEYLEKLESQASDGVKYRQALFNRVSKLAALCEPDIPAQTLKRVLEKMSTDELAVYRDVYEKRTQTKKAARPQLAPFQSAQPSAENDTFVI